MNTTRAGKRILAFALAATLLLCTTIIGGPQPLTAYAAGPEYAADMSIGTWAGDNLPRCVTFGEYNNRPIVWRVLEVYTSDGSDDNNGGKKTALLLADEFVDTRRFDPSSGNWFDSEIKDWLNGESSGDLLEDFSSGDTSAIVNSSYVLGGQYTHTGYNKNTSGSSKVFLLSVEEAQNNRYFTDNADRSARDIWWLRSPGHSAITAALVDPDGTVDPDSATGSVLGTIGIRPALRVNLESSIFTSSKVSYNVEITVEDEDGNPVPGARVSLAPGEEFFTGANGKTVLNRVPAAEYSISVSKAGYITANETISVSEGAIQYTIQLTTPDHMAPVVEFGQFGNASISWQLLHQDGDLALLLADNALIQMAFSTSNNSDWDSSDIKEWLNRSATGDFLEEFAQWETDRIEYYDDAAAEVFLLSKDEVEEWMPNPSTRVTGTYWWLRTESSNNVWRVLNSNGNLATIPANNASTWVRPALWVDLSAVYLASGNTLAPLYSADIAVKDQDGDPLAGARVTLTPPSALPKTALGNPLETEMDTAGGTAGFLLPEGAYDLTVTKQGYGPENGTLAVGSDGTVTGDTSFQLTRSNEPYVSPTTLTIQEGDTGTFTVYLGGGADGADSATITSNDTDFATVAPALVDTDGQVVTVNGVTAGNTTIFIGWSGGAKDNTTELVTVTVTGDGGIPGPGPTSNPSAAIDRDTLQVGETATLRISLGQSGSGSMATGANIAVDEDVVSVNRNSLNADGDVTVTAIRAGETDIHITFDGVSGYDKTIHVKVSDSGTTPPVNPPTTSSGGRSSSSSGGSSTPDSQRAKTTLPASAFSWDGERTLTIDHDSITPLGLLSVRWDDATLTRGTDYGVYSGSVIIRFSEAFMEAQKDGDHTVKVEFLNHTGEASVTVGDTAQSPGQTAANTADQPDNATHNPNTGGYPDGNYPGTDNPNTGGGRGIWPALLLGSLGGIVLVVHRLKPVA